jgi:type II secretory pathway pseudopilin PulG
MVGEIMRKVAKNGKRDFGGAGVEGFTATELIVVIGVVLLLLSVVLPRIARSYGPKGKVDRISCVNSLKMIGTAYHLWADDHNGRFPASESVSNDGWRELLADANQGFRCWTNYAMMADEMGDSPMVVVCPSDERRPALSFSNNFSNTNLSYFIGVSANSTQPQSLLAGDRNLGGGEEPDKDYGFSPTSGQGNDVAIQTNSKTGPVCWSLKMHSQGKADSAGNILLGDGSVQQVSSHSFRSDWQGVVGQTTNWPVGKIPAAASVRVLFP